MKRHGIGALAVGAFASSVAFGASPALAQVAGAEASSGNENLCSLVAALFVAVLTVLLSLALAMWSIKKSIELYNKWTPDIDEMEEIRKGNLAVGILMAAVVYSIASIIAAGVESLTTAIKPFDVSASYAIGVIVGVVNLLVSLVIATFTISLTLRFLNKITRDVDEIAEVGKGNVAVAVLLAGVLIAVANIVQSGVQGIARILEAERVARALGF